MIENLKKTINFLGKRQSAVLNNLVWNWSSKKRTNEEYLERINLNNEYFYDGIEEILSNSDSEQTDNNEDDERLFNDNDRMSFSREQLVEYQQLTKLLRFVKVCFLEIRFFLFE